MPKAHKQFQNEAKSKRIDVPQPRKRIGKDLGVPKLKGLQRAVDAKAARAARGQARNEQTLANMIASSTSIRPIIDDLPEQSTSIDPFSTLASTEHLSALKDSSTRAFTRELKKVIDRSDVIVQVLDARDPEGTRSRWVEDEVRKKESEGKRLMGVVNKIDLVPRENLEAWLKHLRHDFPVMPFKSSTQAQRQNLSQAAIHLSTNTTTSKNPLGSSSTASGSKPSSEPIPTTSASLGAPALLQLLKKYASTHPHQTLTVGFIGYPNVGKSSLINSLKRSRACPVAAMPGKTRVMQEVVLDKGVKVLDCPGVVLDDFDRMGLALGDAEKGRRKGEVLLRNCVKVEEVDDPMAAVEEILRRVEVSKMMELYDVPEYKNITEFLVRVALTRGRLGKGGIPDLIGAATSILRDWNAGKIPYYTQPPKHHPSANLDKETEIATASGDAEMQVESGRPSGDAILSGLGQAFDLDGLFAMSGGGELGEDEWEDVDPAKVGEIDVEEEEEFVQADVPQPDMPIDEDLLDRMASGPREEPPIPAFSTPAMGFASTVTTTSAIPPATYVAPSLPRLNPHALFTPAERALLPNNPDLNPLDRKALKARAKKKAKQSRGAEKKEREADEDMFDASALFGSMSVTQPKRPEIKKKKKKSDVSAKTQKSKGSIAPVTIDAETQKEMDFMSFLNSVGAEGGDADDDDMEL